MWRTGGSVAFIVAPDGASGGGMGRVKDAIVDAPATDWPGLRTVALVTRDDGGRLHSLRLVLRAIATLVRARIDGSLALVHVNFGDRGSALRKGLIVLAARAIGAPVFLHLHAVQLERELARLPRAVRRCLALPFRAATCVIVLGERWRGWLRRDLGVARTPIEILWNGVAIDHAAPPAPAAGDVPPTILFLGHLGERKGVSDLIAALALLPRGDTDARWRACFAGSGDVAHYRALAEQAGIAGRVDFTGWLDQAGARAAVADADMLVLPSYEEGLPLVILEALGLGTPVIATPVGSIPEVLHDGETVLFCRPGDPAGLAAAITRLLGDAGLRARLGANGRAAFDRTFSIHAFRGALLDIWRRHAGNGETRA